MSWANLFPPSIVWPPNDEVARTDAQDILNSPSGGVGRLARVVREAEAYARRHRNGANVWAVAQEADELYQDQPIGVKQTMMSLFESLANQGIAFYANRRRAEAQADAASEIISRVTRRRPSRVANSAPARNLAQQWAGYYNGP